MKKFLSLMLAVVFMTVSLTACGTQKTADTKTDDSKMKIVTTIFPEYDWVKEILGDKAKDADVTMLLDNGTDLHSYQPNAEDISKIANCDLFIYVGGESDEWVDDALKEATNKNMKVINLLDVLGDNVKDEEVKEGMEAEEEESGDAEEEPESDEHVWLSIKNAETIVSAIEAKLAEIDPDNKAEYEKNANDYLAKLDELDKEYKDTLSSIQNKTIIVGDRFPFRYLVNEYGIKYYAAFKGCDAGSEASFETVKFLANKMDELNMSDIFIIDGSKGDLAKTIVDNTKDKNAKVLVLDSMQSTKSSDNASYLDIMKKNLEVLKEVL